MTPEEVRKARHTKVIQALTLYKVESSGDIKTDKATLLDLMLKESPEKFITLTTSSGNIRWTDLDRLPDLGLVQLRTVMPVYKGDELLESPSVYRVVDLCKLKGEFRL